MSFLFIFFTVLGMSVGCLGKWDETQMTVAVSLLVEHSQTSLLETGSRTYVRSSVPNGIENFSLTRLLRKKVVSNLQLAFLNKWNRCFTIVFRSRRAVTDLRHYINWDFRYNDLEIEDSISIPFWFNQKHIRCSDHSVFSDLSPSDGGWSLNPMWTVSKLYKTEST